MTFAAQLLLQRVRLLHGLAADGRAPRRVTG